MTDAVGPVVIACAMEEEAAPFLAALTPGEGIEVPRLPEGFRGPLTFAAGRLEGEDVVVATTGIGMTNAALAMSVVATQLSPRLVIFAGTTGGLGAEVGVGDVIVARSALYHDADATGFGYEPGQIPQMPARYGADADLVEVAQAALEGIAAKRHTSEVSASNSFVTASQVDAVREAFPQVLAVDMETAAGAQVCWAFAIPWIGLRAVSDLCDPSAATAFDENAPSAAQCSFEAAVALLARLAHRSGDEEGDGEHSGH